MARVYRNERNGAGCGRQGEAMAEDGTYWTRGEEARRWHDILELDGPENVRALVANKLQGDWAMISGEKITVGFAHEWLARHDSQKAEQRN